jgi:hypothetical protein
MTDYRFKSGFRPRVLKAEQLAAELDKIEAVGTVTASTVFEAARPKESLLHGEFIWDGTEAVRQLGILRAAALIRAVVVVPDPAASESAHRVWVRISDEASPVGPGHYERMTAVVKDVNLFERALSDLQRKFDAASQALAELKTVADGTSDADRLAAIGLAVQGFGAVREALALLR